MKDLHSSAFQKATVAAEKAVLAAGQFLAARYAVATHNVLLEDAHEKIDDDEKAEQIILDTLHEHFEKNEFSYISEETTRQVKSDITFIIDPIEGTSNYLRGIPFFATQIAIEYQGELVAGFVYEPVKNVLYHAIQGQGCFANSTPIQVGDKTQLQAITLCVGSGSGKDKKKRLSEQIITPLLPQVRSLRIYGATGLELAYVAQGAIDAHINYHSKVYDYAAGAALVKEAGGLVTNFTGDVWTIEENELIASNTTVHQALQKKLAASKK